MNSDLKQASSEKFRRLEAGCRASGLSLTHQRRALLHCLAQRSDHPTADQLYDELKSDVGGLSRTTVYRILDTFVRVGLVSKISSPQAKARFDADMGRHHHIVCEQCGKVADLFDSDFNLRGLPENNSSGFTVHNYEITFNGLCPLCQKIGKENES